MVDVEKINFKETCYEQAMRYQFPYRALSFMFYNWYTCLHGFARRNSHVVRKSKGVVDKQMFLYHREGMQDDKYINCVSQEREHKPTSM